jgi:hypothetical protein
VTKWTTSTEVTWVCASYALTRGWPSGHHAAGSRPPAARMSNFPAADFRINSLRIESAERLKFPSSELTLQNFFNTFSWEDKAWAESMAFTLVNANDTITIQAWHFWPGSNLCKCWDGSGSSGSQGRNTLPNALCFANRLVIVALFSCIACNDERLATDVHPHN